jgi:voltage-gated potassium channel
MDSKTRRRVFEILEVVNPEDFTTRVFFVFITTLIIANVFAVMLDTVEDLHIKYYDVFWRFEVFSVGVFTLEYLLRIWSCIENVNFRSPITGRLKFGFTPLALVDLFAILPFYLPLLIPFDLRFIRILRLFRVFRVLKVGRYSEAMKTVSDVVKKTKEEVVTSIFILLILLMIVSTLMYYAEHEAQPQKFRNVFDAMWWAIITLTTVGYGDIYPVTLIGKILASIAAILGIGMFAIPAGILASGFLEEIQKKRRKKSS